MNATNAVCTKCGHAQRGVPKRTFLAFLQFRCEACRERFLYPLTSGYRTFYRVLVGIAVLAVLGALARGRPRSPSWLPLAAVLALVKDARIRKEVAAAEVASDGRASVPGPPHRTSE